MASELEGWLGLAQPTEAEPEPEVKIERDQYGRFARRPMAKCVAWQHEFSKCSQCHTTWRWRRYANLKQPEYRVCADCVAREVNRQNRVRAAIFRGATRGRLDH